MTIPLDRRSFLKSAALAPLGAAALAVPAALSAVEPVHRTGGARIKLSLNAFSFNDALMAGLNGESGGIGLLELLDFCAEQDFDGIDPTGYYFPGYPAVPEREFSNAFKKRAHQLGIAISGTGIRNNFAQTDAAARAADVALAKAWIEAAERLGAPVIRVFAGAVPAGYEDRWEEAAEWMVDALREVADHGARHGVIVGVQNHGDMIRNAEQCRRVVEWVDSEWFGLILDTGFMQVDDPYADIAAALPLAVNWQVKESPFGQRSPIRTDLPRLYRIIHDGGYRGHVPIETLWDDRASYDPFQVVPAFAAEVRAAMAAAAG